jgi:hypothetical protein
MPATVTLSVQERWNASTLYHVDVRSQVGFKQVKGKTVADFESLAARVKSADTPGMPEMPALPKPNLCGSEVVTHGASSFSTV